MQIEQHSHRCSDCAQTWEQESSASSIVAQASVVEGGLGGGSLAREQEGPAPKFWGMTREQSLFSGSFFHCMRSCY